MEVDSQGTQANTPETQTTQENNTPDSLSQSTGTERSNSSQQYISNPFQVFIDSFRRLFTVNFSTFLAYIGVALLSIGAVVALAVVIGISGNAAENGFTTAITIFGFLLVLPVLAWVFILKATWDKYIIETAREQETSFGIALRTGLRKAPGYIGLTILVSVIVMLGLVLLIVPGLIFLYWFIFAPFVYIDKDVGVIAALKQSKRLVKGKLVELLGLVGATFVFGIPAGIPFLGWLYQIVFTPVSNLAIAYRYTSADMLDQAALPKPETDVTNIVMTWILGILGLGLIAALIIALMSL